MPFSNPIIGGDGTLIRDAIRSADYVPGSAGWAINRDGTVEFSDGVFRGDISAATGGFSGSLSVGSLTSGTMSAAATLGGGGKVRTAAAGSRVELDAAGLRAYDGTGANTVDIASTGNATIVGDFATGRAGGSTAYVTMNDGADRSTISLWNREGTDAAYMNSPRAVDGTPGLGLNTGTYPISGATNGFSRLYLAGANYVQLGTVRSSDQSAYGGEFFASDVSASMRRAPLGGAHTGGEVYVDSDSAEMARNVNGLANGGRVKADPSAAYVEYAASGGGVNGIAATSTGVRTYGTFLSNIGWSATPGGSVAISEFRMDRWGPFVTVHVLFTVTVAIGAGNIADQTIATISSAGNLPLSQTSCACQWSAGVGAVALDSTGNMVLRWTAAVLAVGDTFRVDTAYFNG